MSEISVEKRRLFSMIGEGKEVCLCRQSRRGDWYIRRKDRACEGKESSVKRCVIRTGFDVSVVGYEGNLSANHSIIAEGRRKCWVVLNDVH